MPKQIFGLVSLVLLFLGLVACGDNTATYAPAISAAATTAAAYGTTAPGGGQGNPTANPNQTPAPQEERKVIRNATIAITSLDVEQTLAQLRALAVEQGGIVFSENTSQDSSPGGRPGGVIVLQIPSQQYEATVTRIRQLAVKVVRQESTAQDVTDEYVDLRSQITNLQRTEEGLQKLMDKTQKLDEVLALQRELTNVRGEIEKRQGRLNFIDKRAAFSTLTINVTYGPVVEAAKPTTEEIWQPQSAATNAWDASLKLLGAAGMVVIRVAVFFWWLLPGLIVGLIWALAKKPWLKKSSQPEQAQG